MPTPTPTPRGHLLLLGALLLLLLAAGAAAQPDEHEPWDKPWDRRNNDDDGDGRGGMMTPGAARQPPSFSAPMVVLLVALIATFFFIGFFSIYIRRCGRGDAAPHASAFPAAALLALSRHEQHQQSQNQQQRRGLDPDVVASFPAMTYAEARALREDGGKGSDDAALECAVCLSEFEDEEQLRLLPECSHAFHPDCIGEWLAGHVTCPVCRRSLVPEPEEKAAATAAEADGSGEQERRPEVVVIDVDRDGDEERRREAAELERIGSLRRAVRSRSGRPFSRAHSTGHSLSARLDGDLERFTLRLPERVRREMVSAGEESLRRTVGRGARSARIGRSDRWPSFIARTFSSRVPFWAASRRAPADAELPPGSTTPATIREKSGDSSVSSAKGSLRFDCLGVGGVTGARVSSAAGDSEDEPEEEKAIVRRV